MKRDRESTAVVAFIERDKACNGERKNVVEDSGKDKKTIIRNRRQNYH